MRATPRPWLVALLAGLFGWASLGVPALHLRALPDAELAAYAMPDGTLPVLCHGGDPDHDRHDDAGYCLACVLAAAPGLLAATAAFGRAPVPAEAAVAAGPARLAAGSAWHPQRARAPPLRLRA